MEGMQTEGAAQGKGGQDVKGYQHMGVHDAREIMDDRYLG